MATNSKTTNPAACSYLSFGSSPWLFSLFIKDLVYSLASFSTRRPLVDTSCTSLYCVIQSTSPRPSGGPQQALLFFFGARSEGNKERLIAYFLNLLTMPTLIYLQSFNPPILRTQSNITKDNHTRTRTKHCPQYQTWRRNKSLEESSNMKKKMKMQFLRKKSSGYSMELSERGMYAPAHELSPFMHCAYNLTCE